MEQSALRSYGGISGGQRQAERRAQIVAAGLELLGRPGGDELTVRGVRQLTGLATRYFYESFADRDALALAVHASVVSEVAQAAARAVDTSPEPGLPRARAGVAAIVAMIRDDPRKGRILFEPRPQHAAARRHGDLFARLLAERIPDAPGTADPGRRAVTAQFAVGGLGQVLTSWLGGRLQLGDDELVSVCAGLLLSVTG